MAAKDDISRDFEPGVTENILRARSDRRAKNALEAAGYRSLVRDDIAKIFDPGLTAP
jgi:hypothetical protein